MQPDTQLIPSGEPEELEVDTPNSVQPPNGMAITVRDRREAQKALKKSGMTTIDLTRLEAKSEIGKFVIALGLFRLSATKWVATAEDLESCFDKSVELYPDVQNPEARVELLKVQDSLLKKRVELIAVGFKAGAEDIKAQTVNTPGNVPFPANCPVSVQIVSNNSEVNVK